MNIFCQQKLSRCCSNESGRNHCSSSQRVIGCTTGSSLVMVLLPNAIATSWQRQRRLTRLTVSAAGLVSQKRCWSLFEFFFYIEMKLHTVRSKISYFSQYQIAFMYMITKFRLYNRYLVKYISVLICRSIFERFFFVNISSKKPSLWTRDSSNLQIVNDIPLCLSPVIMCNGIIWGYYGYMTMC